MKTKYCKPYCELTVKGYETLCRIFSLLNEEDQKMYESDLHELEDILLELNDIKFHAGSYKVRIDKYESMRDMPKIIIDNEYHRGSDLYAKLDDGTYEKICQVNDSIDKKKKAIEDKKAMDKLFHALFSDEEIEQMYKERQAKKKTKEDK